MNKYVEDLRRLSHRMMDEKEPYYTETKKYFSTVMKGMEQTELMEALHDLNIHELKQCLAAGVPGHAMHEANLLLRKLKEEIKAYIEKKGSEATAIVEVETSKEEKEDVVEGVRPSKERGEGDSGEMGETSTNSGP